MGKNYCTENEITTFDNEEFIERARRVTAPYGYTYKNCAYLRFCFLLYYFEIDIISLHEKESPHIPPADEKYDFNFYVKKSKKEFFHDIPRSNKQRNSFALKPYIELFEKKISQIDFYGLYPDVKNYMKNILLLETDTQTIISEYENFIAFFSKMLFYLSKHYDSDLIEYGNNSELYIECLTNNDTQEVWYDVYRYPIYIVLDTNIINTDISNNPKYWNYIFENWDVFLLLSNELLVWNLFKQNFFTNVRNINKCISQLFIGNDYSKTDLLLDNAEKYSCFFSISFTMPERSIEHIQKLAKKRVQTFQAKQCYLFCKENYEILRQLNKHNIRLLFRIACLATGTPQEIPRLNLNNFFPL